MKRLAIVGGTILVAVLLALSAQALGVTGPTVTSTLLTTGGRSTHTVPSDQQHQPVSPDPGVDAPTLPPGMTVHSGDTVVFPTDGGTPHLVTTSPTPLPLPRP